MAFRQRELQLSSADFLLDSHAACDEPLTEFLPESFPIFPRAAHRTSPRPSPRMVYEFARLPSHAKMM